LIDLSPGDRNPHEDQINANQSPPATYGTIQFICIMGGITADGGTWVNQQQRAGMEYVSSVSATLFSNSFMQFAVAI
jgi:hypothetical protein